MNAFCKLSISQSHDAQDCYDIRWTAKEKYAELTDCIDTTTDIQHVFGGASNWYEYWPKNRQEQSQSGFDAFVSEDIFQGHNYTYDSEMMFCIKFDFIIATGFTR